MDIKEAYKQLKLDHPEAYAALAILPISGQAAAIADYAEAMSDGDSQGASMAAASLIPGVRLAKYGSKLAPATLRLASKMNPVEKAIAPITKKAPTIGKAMGIEQAGEYASSKLDKSSKPHDEVAQNQAEYSEAWNQD